MSLNAELAKMKQERASKRPEDVSKLMAQENERLEKLGVGNNSLKEGDKVPFFTLTNATGKSVSLKNLLKNGPVVISFYRGAWCPYCNMELRALQQAQPEIEAAGGQLVAISPNLPDASLTSIEKHNLTFEVLSDVGNNIARQFGLVFTLGDKLRPIYTKIGHDIPGQNGDETWELPLPATYVVDTGGTIVYSFVNRDYTQRAEPAELVKVLKQAQQKVAGPA